MSSNSHHLRLGLKAGPEKVAKRYFLIGKGCAFNVRKIAGSGSGPGQTDE